MKLFLVRHGETSWNKEGRFQGSIDIELSETGLNQAEKISERLKEQEFDYIISSPLKRAKVTAETISKHHSNKIILDSNLKERSFGDYEGKRHEELDWEEYEKAEILHRKAPNGESISELVYRVNNTLDNLDYDKKNILLVSHGGTMRALLYSLLNISLEETNNMPRPKNTALYILERRDNKWNLVLDNCTIHLKN